MQHQVNPAAGRSIMGIEHLQHGNPTVNRQNNNLVPHKIDLLLLNAGVEQLLVDLVVDP
ncbi:hypothetical protein D3C73_1662280 [compost metagenome]